MADPVERIKAAWPNKAATLDRLLEALADRAEELADTGGSADLEAHFKIHRGVLSEARLDRDERFA